MIWPGVRFSSNILFNVWLNMLDICNVNSNAVMYYGFAMEKCYYILVSIRIIIRLCIHMRESSFNMEEVYWHMNHISNFLFIYNKVVL